MPEALSFASVALRYDGTGTDAVGPVTFTVAAGERVLLLGPSGAGKSTLLHAVTGLIPHAIPGQRSGDLRIGGHCVASRRPAEWADTVGYLFQDADQTLAGFTVADEVAFALENRNLPPQDIPGRVVAALARAGLSADWMARPIATLSGGEKQLVAVAALVAQAAPVTLADEPSAGLAPQAAARMAALILAPGSTTMMVDHTPGPLLNRIDRCVAIGRGGGVIADGPPTEVLGQQAGALAAEDIALPLAGRLHLAFPDRIRPSLSVASALDGVPKSPDVAARLQDVILAPEATPGATLVTLKGAACAPPYGPVVLKDVSLTLATGEVLAIVGPNGAGKSTLAACLAGLAAPQAGTRSGAPGAVAFQNPEAHFSRESVTAEIAALPIPAEKIPSVLAHWRLSAVADHHPFTLSQGQKRRLALALLAESDRWPLLILDEPTNGLDGGATAALAARIHALAAEGRGVAVITHDLDFALSVAGRAVLVHGGRIQFDGPCPALMRDMDRLAGAGLLPPEATPVLEWMDQAC